MKNSIICCFGQWQFTCNSCVGCPHTTTALAKCVTPCSISPLEISASPAWISCRKNLVKRGKKFVVEKIENYFVAWNSVDKAKYRTIKGYFVENCVQNVTNVKETEILTSTRILHGAFTLYNVTMYSFQKHKNMCEGHLCSYIFLYRKIWCIFPQLAHIHSFFKPINWFNS